MIEIRNLQKELNGHLTQKEECERGIIDEQSSFAEISIKKEKLEIDRGKLLTDEDPEKEGEVLEIEREIEELENMGKLIESNIESLESRIDFISQKLGEGEMAISELQNQSMMNKLPFESINSLDRALTCLRAFFDIILRLRLEKADMEETILEQDNRIQEFIKQVKTVTEAKRHIEMSL